MSDFKATMHQIRFPLGLRLRPRWGSLQRSPRPKGTTTVLKLGGPSTVAANQVEAPKAPRGVGRGAGVSPSPLGKGSGRGPCPLPRKKNWFFIWKWWVLVHSGWRFRAVCSYCTREWGKRGRKRKSPGEGRHSALIVERPIHQILYFHLCWT